MLPPFNKRVYQRTDKPNQQNLSNRWKIIQLSNQQENKLKKDFLEHLLQSEFQWRLVQYQRCLEVDLKLIDNHHQIRKMSFSSYHASRKNKILTATNILLSFDLRKSEIEEQEKRERSWCHNYLFLMSLLPISNNINHH